MVPYASFFVMPAHSRPKDGVLSHAYVAGIHIFNEGNYALCYAAVSAQAHEAPRNAFAQ